MNCFRPPGGATRSSSLRCTHEGVVVTYFRDQKHLGLSAAAQASLPEGELMDNAPLTMNCYKPDSRLR
jgi:hypothetical protein